MSQDNLATQPIEEVQEDYSQGLLHMLWLFTPQGRKLIFAEFELYPQDISEVDESVGIAANEPKLRGKIDDREQCLGLPDKTRLFYIRIKKTSGELFKQYASIVEQQTIPMDWCAKGAVCHTEGLECAMPWPFFALSSREKNDDVLTFWPYLAQAWGVVRTHHLFPIALGNWIKPVLTNAKPAKWIEERLGWDLSTYPELWGSVHLTLPNPLYRQLHVRLVPAQDVEGNEYISVIMHKRNRDITADLKLILLEKRVAGLVGRPPIKLTLNAGVHTSSSSIELTGEAEKIGYTIYCRKRGLLDYGAFTGFLKTMQLHFSIPQRERINLHLEDGAQVIERTNRQGEEMTLGEEIPRLEDWGNRILRHRLERASKQSAEEMGQVWLDTPELAREKIKSILERAETALIVDPYFSQQEFFDFVVAVCPENVRLIVVTGREGLGRSVDERKKKGEELLRLLDGMHAIHSWKIEFEVMTGDKPLIHDRFLVLDNSTVWLSGSSLNNIGERGCILTKLHDAKSIIGKITEARANGDRMKKLRVYLNSISANNEQVAVSKNEGE